MNKFRNSNSISFLRFLFLRNESLPFLAINFISRINSTSARKFPLLEFSTKTRIVYIYGLTIPKTDFLIIKFIAFCIKLLEKKISKYKLVWVMFNSEKCAKTNQIIDLDDPTYSNNEILDLKLWQSKLESIGKKGLILVTNDFTKKWLNENNINDNIILIPQGHWNIEFSKKKFINEGKIKLAYVSPYIDIKGDKHFGHESWDASHLLENIWPEISVNKNFELHLFGRIGQNALRKLQGTNYINHGLMDQEECAKELLFCDIGLYPRTFDSKRQVQKVVAYLGAGLPIITYKTIDTSIVEEKGIGITVNSEKDFILAVRDIVDTRDKFENYLNNIMLIQSNYNWNNLALKLEKSIESFLFK